LSKVILGSTTRGFSTRGCIVTDADTSDKYLWDNTLEEEKRRLDLQAAIWDPRTRGYLERIGVAAGWRCLEIGAGSGTITTWLADIVTPGGSVVAADIDTRFLQWIDHPAVETRELDITSGPISEGGFDLVHARMVLMHLSDPGKHVATMVDALRPGGWLLVQDVDLAYLETPAAKAFSWPPSNREFAAKIVRALNGLLSMAGASTTTASEHPTRLLEAGLQNVGAESINRMEWGKAGGTYAAAFDRVKEYLVQYAGLSEADVTKRSEQLANQTFAFSSGPMVSVWGQRP